MLFLAPRPSPNSKTPPALLLNATSPPPPPAPTAAEPPPPLPSSPSPAPTSTQHPSAPHRPSPSPRKYQSRHRPRSTSSATPRLCTTTPRISSPLLSHDGLTTPSSWRRSRLSGVDQACVAAGPDGPSRLRPTLLPLDSSSCARPASNELRLPTSAERASAAQYPSNVCL
ncbi:uncharacterized protein A4U43_C04F18090 [Asparagus officinalis]|uniref:Uncharacterized protein n=1 Tax=Asparagus officinalis TaxID=4686 RepID=A0A5P1F1T1_ASPOF|nr:uncharacterized protein A4U43_C04F18090 [Asparagus officinalis]